MTQTTKKPHIDVIEPIVFDKEALKLIELGMGKIRIMTRKEMEERYGEN